MRMFMLSTILFAVGTVGCAKQMQVKQPKFVQAPAPAPVSPTKEEKPEKVAPAPAPVRIATVKAAPQPPKTIHFGYNQYTLTPAAKRELQGHMDWFRTQENATIQISGHCDQRGSVEYNLLLGERRANAVKQYLTHMGVPQERLLTISYGHQKPVSTETTAEAYAKNRRSEFQVRDRAH